MTKASVIIPAWNEHEITTQCVKAVQDSCEGIEIILVDNGSDPPFKFPNAFRDNLKIVRSEQNKGFGGGINAGLLCASEDFLVILNNDTVPQGDWLDRLIACHAKATEAYAQVCKVGLVGPVSNFVAGRQHSPLMPDLPPAMTGFLSGFCMLISRECYEAVGDFEEWNDESVGGFEDNDYVMRAALAGYGAMIDYSTHVHHIGSKTIDKFPEANRGIANRDAFANKWRKIFNYENPTIAVGYRVKNVARWIHESLKASLEFADKICILDDGSTDGTSDTIFHLIQEGHNIQHMVNFREFDEERDRKELYEMLYDSGCDWLLSLDGDEVLYHPERLQRLIRPCNPEIMGWNMPVHTLWDESGNIRIDGIFGNLAGMRLARRMPWGPYSYVSGGLHMTHLPPLPVEWARYCNVPITHYGYEFKELREDKHDRYSTLDTAKIPYLVGTATGEYEHLLSPVVMLAENKDPGKISLNILSRKKEFNSVLRLLWAVEDVFDEVIIGLTDTEAYEPLPSWSKASTHKICFEGVFNEARNELKQNTKADWILQLDPDEMISPDIAREMHLQTRAIPTHMGFIIRIVNILPEGKQLLTELPRLYRNLAEISYEGDIHEAIGKSILALGGTLGRLNQGITHYGYVLDPTDVRDKFRTYWNTNIEMLKKDPEDGKSWFNLAMHYINEGLRVDAILMLEAAMKLNAVDPTRRELIYQHMLRSAELAEAVLTEGAEANEIQILKFQMIAWMVRNLLTESPKFDGGIKLEEFPGVSVRLDIRGNGNADNNASPSRSAPEMGIEKTD